MEENMDKHCCNQKKGDDDKIKEGDIIGIRADNKINKHKTNKEKSGFLSGLFYGLLPHAGCIAFIVFSILGITAATTLLKPLLLNPYFFYLLILLSFVFATISAAIYLKRAELFSWDGAKRKWKYLSILYGTSIAANLVLFLFIFPLAANLATATSADSIVAGDTSKVSLMVEIPCPGHAPLISGELKSIKGVSSVEFRFPNYFDVEYDSSQTSEAEMLSLDVFRTYPATIVSTGSEVNDFSEGKTIIRNQGNTANEGSTATKTGCSKCSGCSGACGGSCAA